MKTTESLVMFSSFWGLAKNRVPEMPVGWDSSDQRKTGRSIEEATKGRTHRDILSEVRERKDLCDGSHDTFLRDIQNDGAVALLLPAEDGVVGGDDALGNRARGQGEQRQAGAPP